MADILHTDLISGWGELSIGAPGLSAWSLYFDLFVNDETFTCDIDPSALTVCSAPGYTSYPAGYSGWAADVSACIWTATFGPFNIELTGDGSPAQTIYGHWVHNGSDAVTGQIGWGLTWPTPYLIPANGGIIQVSLELTVEQCAVAGQLAAIAPKISTKIAPVARAGARRKAAPAAKKK